MKFPDLQKAIIEIQHWCRCSTACMNILPEGRELLAIYVHAPDPFTLSYEAIQALQEKGVIVETIHNDEWTTVGELSKQEFLDSFQERYTNITTIEFQM